ncbi:hypothetical protein ACA910_006176 [Epithemia clementina (nom. ined.)]
MNAEMRVAVDQSKLISRDDESASQENDASVDGNATSDTSDADSTPDYTDYALSMAPAGYASIPKADRDVVFASKLLCMLDSIEEEGLDYIIGWQPHGRCFIVRDHKLILQILLKYLKISKWATFHRQLYVYGFKRITQGPDKGAYYHEKFLRGRPFLAAQMTRVQARGLRGRKKVTEEPNFWNMPWVKPVESIPPTTNRSHRAVAQPERHLQMSMHQVRRSPPPLIREVARLRDDHGFLINENSTASQYVPLSSTPQLFYLKESTGEMIRVEDPHYVQSMSSPLTSSSSQPDGSSWHMLQSQVRHAPAPAPVTPQRLSSEYERALQARMSMLSQEEALPIQVAMFQGQNPPQYTNFINGNQMYISEQQRSAIDPRSSQSNTGLYPVHYRGSPVLHSSNHLSMRSAQGTTFLNQHHLQQHVLQQRQQQQQQHVLQQQQQQQQQHVLQQQQQQQQWFSEHALQSTKSPSPASNYAQPVPRYETVYHNPVRAVSSPVAPIQPEMHIRMASSQQSVASSPPAPTKRTEVVTTPPRTAAKEKTLPRRVPAVSPTVSKNDTEQQVAEGLLMLCSN